MRLCMGCMELIKDGLAVCPRCGYAEEAGVQKGYNLRPGTMLQNRYLLGRVLDWGRSGITYIGYDVRQQRKTAVREYLPVDFAARILGKKDAVPYPGAAGEQFMAGLSGFLKDGERWKDFAEIPETVDIYDCFRENSTGYIVMEYLKGNTVKELLEKKKRLSYDEAEKIICHVLAGLSAVHKRGIILGDVVPDNLFITEEGKIKLLNFGAERYAASIYSRSLPVILEPGYAPEEQYHSHGKQGPWTDVYGAGATFYRMITGICPQRSLERRIKDDLRSPSELGAEIPPEKEAVLMKSLAVRAEDRIQSAEEFRKALAGKVPDSIRKEDKREKEQTERTPEGGGDSGPSGSEESEGAGKGTSLGGKLFVKLGIVCCIVGIFFAGFYSGRGMIGGGDVQNAVSTVKTERNGSDSNTLNIQVTETETEEKNVAGAGSESEPDDTEEPETQSESAADAAADSGTGVLEEDITEQMIDGSVRIDETHFPDETFRAYVDSMFDENKDGVLSSDEIEKIVGIGVGVYSGDDSGEIKSLKGIEYFTFLENLSCGNNQLSSLDVSQNPALKTLWCGSNQLSSLDVSQNPELETLWCGSNQLSSLDVSRNTKLTDLDCDTNQLSSLDVSQNTKLTTLWCFDNQLNSLDVSHNPRLKIFSCGSNQLDSLDVSQNTELTELYCYSNQLRNLDVSQNPELETLWCGINQLSSLDVSQNTKLTDLDCAINQLSSLDVSQNTELIELSCFDNQLSSLDVSQNAALETLDCSGNQLNGLDVSQNPALKEFTE